MEVRVKFNEINVIEEKDQTLVKILMLKGEKGEKGDPGPNDYNDLINTPTKLSEFTNDGVFITNAVDDLANYYKKSETYTQTETNNLLDNKVDKTSVVQATGNSTTSVMSQDAVTTQLNGKATTTVYTAALPAVNWSSSAPYTQTINISGILATDNPIVDVVLDANTSTAMTQISAWLCVSKIVTSDGSITATCLENKPITDIPIQLKVVR